MYKSSFRGTSGQKKGVFCLLWRRAVVSYTAVSCVVGDGKQNRKAEIKREVLKDLEKIMAVAILSTLKRTSIAGRDANLVLAPVHYSWGKVVSGDNSVFSELKSPQPPVEEEDEHWTTQWFVLILVSAFVSSRSSLSYQIWFLVTKC